MTTQDAIGVFADGWIACAKVAIARIQSSGVEHAISELRRLCKNGNDVRSLMKPKIESSRAIPRSPDDLPVGVISTRAPPINERQRRPQDRARSLKVRDWLLSWLTERESDVLPRLAAISRECPMSRSLNDIDRSLRILHLNGLIVRRTGTVSEYKGHSAIRVITTGRVLKTAGCPFEPPEGR